MASKTRNNTTITLDSGFHQYARVVSRLYAQDPNHQICTAHVVLGDTNSEGLKGTMGCMGKPDCWKTGT